MPIWAMPMPASSMQPPIMLHVRILLCPTACSLAAAVLCQLTDLVTIPLLDLSFSIRRTSAQAVLGLQRKGQLAQAKSCDEQAGSLAFYGYICREALDAKTGEYAELEAAKAEVAQELAEAQSSIAELSAEKDSLQSSLAATKTSLQACEDTLVSAEVSQLIGHPLA
jgi:hypothetical protein